MTEKINYEEYLDVLDSTHKYILNFKTQLNKTIKRLRKTRDSGDEMVKSMNEFFTKTEINLEKNSNFNQKYRQYSQCLSIIEDNRDAQIERLETRLMKSFDSLIECLKITRSKYKPLLHIYEKECYRNRKIIESQVSNSFDELIFLKGEMKSLIENFEIEKSETFDGIFKEMTLINMSFCTQATKVYTNAFKCLSSKSESIDINLAEMTKSLYQHNFESALMDLTNKMDKPAQDIPKFPYPIKNSKNLNNGRTPNPSPNCSININNNHSMTSNKYVSSNSLFGIIKLKDDDEDLFDNEQDNTESSSEDESYESKKEKARLEFLQSLNETEL